MTTGTCSRCGASGMVEYGSDGQSYCQSCIFYGMNKQCWRCRMYLPASELQQYRGQWMCPYCVQDMRDEDRRKQETPVSKPRVEAYAIPEQCDRCGRNLDSLVYFWNGRKLCKNCVEAEKEKWGLVGGGPMSAPYRVSLAPERRRKKMSFLESLISDALHLLGIRKRKQMEVIVINDKMPISLAKPMAERAMEGGAERPAAKPETEGIMKKQPIVSPKQMKWDSAKSEVHKLAGKGAIVSKKPRHRRRKAKGDGKKNQ